MAYVRPINTGGNPANISNPFGPYHPGIDYAYPEGTKVYAAEDGKVTIAKGNETRQWLANTASDPFRINGTRSLRTEDYGNFIKIDHGAGKSTLYAHLKYDSLYVKVGQLVKKGQLIAEVGSTGNSSGNHLHWEIRLNDQTHDPSVDFDSNFTAYKDEATPSAPAGHVAVDANVFPILVHGSSQWDKTSEKYLPGRKPSETNFEDLDRSIAAIQGHYNDLTNKLSTAEQEIKNREEQVSRLKEDVTRLLEVEKSLTDQLKRASTLPADTLRAYQEQLKSKQDEVDRVAAEKGAALTDAAQWKNKFESCQKGVDTVRQNLISQIMAFLRKLGGK